MSALARWCYRRGFTVLALWVAGLIVLGGLSQAAGDQYTDSFSLPGTESSRALDLLKASFPTQSGDSDQIVWHVTRGSVTDPAVKARVTAILAKAAKGPHVVGIASPYERAN